MKKILIVSGFGIKSTFPNAICELKIVELLKKDPEIEIDIACDGVVEKTPVLNWKKNPWYMLRRIMLWPSINPEVEKICKKEISECLKNKEYDCLFIPHKPYEIVHAGERAVKKYSKIKLFLYELDPIANEIDANNGVGKYLFFLTNRAEKRAYKLADHIFHMECNRKKYSGKKYIKFADKSSYLDFPLIEHQEREGKKAEEYKGEPVLFVFSGAVDNTYRSPKYLVRLMEYVYKFIPIQMHFYTKGNSTVYIEAESHENDCISLHGYIPKKELDKKIDDADCLVNIGNKFSTMLPSKLLSYFMTGKPIIHIKNQNDDACISYLKRYGLCIIINETDSIEKSGKKLIEFVRHTYKCRLSAEYIERTFVQNTPEWNVKEIKKYL